MSEVFLGKASDFAQPTHIAAKYLPKIISTHIATIKPPAERSMCNRLLIPNTSAQFDTDQWRAKRDGALMPHSLREPQIDHRCS